MTVHFNIPLFFSFKNDTHLRSIICFISGCFDSVLFFVGVMKTMLFLFVYFNEFQVFCLCKTQNLSPHFLFFCVSGTELQSEMPFSKKPINVDVLSSQRQLARWARLHGRQDAQIGRISQCVLSQQMRHFNSSGPKSEEREPAKTKAKEDPGYERTEHWEQIVPPLEVKVKKTYLNTLIKKFNIGRWIREGLEFSGNLKEKRGEKICIIIITIIIIIIIGAVQDKGLLAIISSTISVGVYAFIGVTLLRALGFDTTPFVAGFSFAGAALGFGLKDVAYNYVAGIILAIEGTFRYDDLVTIGGAHMGGIYKGVVKQMTLRHLQIDVLDPRSSSTVIERIYVPNSTVFGNTIFVHQRGLGDKIHTDTHSE
ncbi:hypothetical protein RFI_37932 [Reticulomyxa filosa]|uniref:Uncharacterized protein n=1 Tax=Reticulomyxa filosa TaxID=46433 RepID=X6LDB2_RETFI|nr:hypothetical protein RFI_37932 [Reticulomyxa filosa]|eukprot:ETN99538.1 hypothetical protein RFI_37932 [Reticulomyxa filosa]